MMMKRLPVNLWDWQHKAIKDIAHKDETSMSDVVRDAVDEYLKKKSKTSRDDKRRK